MRRATIRIRSIRLGLAILAAGSAMAAPALAQQAYPNIPNAAERSGLIGRFLPYMKTNLPHDKDRDNFYGTRVGDYATSGQYNSVFGGGLYGLPLDSSCSRAIPAYFNGAPGNQSPLPACCKPWYKNGPGRVVQSFIHPFRPVGHYYQNGNYVPIYDLGPFSPGPGPDLWPFYHNGYNGG